LLTRFGRELKVRPFDDRVHRARLGTEPAIDALHHVDVVARRPAAPVLARLGLDGDRQCRTHRLAQLARYAALLAIGIAAQRMLATEARALRGFLVGVVDRRLRLEEVLQRERVRLEEFPEREGLEGAGDHAAGPP